MEEKKKEEKQFQSSYTKGQRVFAMIGVIFLLALYLVTLISALTTSPATPALFKMCICSSFLLLFIFWLYFCFAILFVDRGCVRTVFH